MDNVWFGCVLRRRVVTYVLRRVENLERQSVQKLALCEQTANWLKPPASLASNEVRNGAKLGDFISRETLNIFFHIIYCLISLFASICSQQRFQLWVAIPPNSLFIFIVRYGRDLRVVNAVVQSYVCDHVSPCSVLFVFERRMIDFLDSVTFRKDTFADEIEIFDPCREPRHFWGSDLLHSVGNYVEFLDCFLDHFAVYVTL